MTYFITYLSSSNEPHTIEWIAPEAWSPAAVSQAFAERHPGAQLLSMEPAE